MSADKFLNPLSIGRLPDGIELAKVMRAFCPLPTDDYIKYMTVKVLPGKEVAEHKHGEHTVIFYPATCDPLIVTPQAGMMLYLPPDTPHKVPIVTHERLSVAMLVTDAS